MSGTESDLDGLDLLPEAVVVLAGDRSVVHVNDRARALLGLEEDVTGLPFSKALELLDDAGTPCGDTFLPPPGVATRVSERILRVVLPDGRRRPVSVAGRYHHDRLVLTFRSAGRRERVDRVRSDLVATVSHEIRSPLTSVKGFTRTLLTRWERFNDEQKKTMLETINEDADRVTRLLKELLDVSRIDAGRVQVHRQRVDLSDLTRLVVDKVALRPEGDRREVRLEIDDDLPPILADPDKIEQILTNLVENALKYAPDAAVTVRITGHPGEVHAVVSDRGPGIPADQVRRVFEKFGRARGQSASGTGLGLYITRGLVLAHGGRVWCESTEGEGAAFHVVLPIDPGIDG